MWTPDVYEGSPTSITSFFSVVPKVVGLAVLIRFMMSPFKNIFLEWQTIIIFISIASMILGAVAAIGQTNFKSTAKDIFITSQLRSALIFNKKTKARNYTLETINKNIYIFGIAMDDEEKKEVMNEANKIFDVQNIIPSIYLVSELSRNKL